jgi:hypothetical protein
MEAGTVPRQAVEPPRDHHLRPVEVLMETPLIYDLDDATLEPLGAHDDPLVVRAAQARGLRRARTVQHRGRRTRRRELGAARVGDGEAGPACARPRAFGLKREAAQRAKQRYGGTSDNSPPPTTEHCECYNAEDPRETQTARGRVGAGVVRACAARALFIRLYCIFKTKLGLVL